MSIYDEVYEAAYNDEFEKIAQTMGAQVQASPHASARARVARDVTQRFGTVPTPTQRRAPAAGGYSTARPRN